MGKKFIALFLCMSLLVCSALTGCSTNTTADGHEVKIIRVAFNQNEDHPQYKAMRELGDKFEDIRWLILTEDIIYDDMDHLRRTTLSGAFDDAFQVNKKVQF